MVARREVMRRGTRADQRKPDAGSETIIDVYIKLYKSMRVSTIAHQWRHDLMRILLYEALPVPKLK